MKVQIDKSFKVDAPIEDVWALLSNPSRVVTCVPGAKITETIDEQNYKGTVSMKIGPVVTNFKGDIKIEALDEATHNLVLVGNGMDAKGKGSASMRLVGTLQPQESGGTEVTTSMEVSVIGRLAQFGARLMEDVSNRVFEQFVTCFQSSLHPPEATPVEATPADAPTEQADGSPAPTPADPAPSSTPDPPAPATEPVKALPLLFQALGDAVRRFFRRLTGRAEKA